MKRRGFLKAALAVPAIAGFPALAARPEYPLNRILQFTSPVVTATPDFARDFWTIYVDGEATISTSGITLVQRGWRWVIDIAIRCHENRHRA